MQFFFSQIVDPKQTRSHIERKSYSYSGCSLGKGCPEVRERQFSSQKSESNEAFVGAQEYAEDMGI
jgi:hypothetical protein